MSLQEIKYDTNGHRINVDGSLVYDEDCEVCVKERRPQKEKSHKQEFIPDPRGEVE